MTKTSDPRPVVPGEGQRPFYRDIGGESEVFNRAVSSSVAVLLKGPTGCGKSRFIEAMAFDLGRPLITVSCNEDTSATDLLGRFIIRGGDTIWQDGPATRAVRSGAILYLDEITEAREDVIVVLHALSDHRRQLFVDRLNETLHAPKDFVLVASFNPGYQTVLKEMKPSTRQRFVVLPFDYPEADLEAEIVAKEGGGGKEQAKRLAEFARRVRQNKDLVLRETVSTRLLVHAAKLAAAGLHLRRAGDAAIIQTLTDDPDQVAALRDLAALIL